MAEQQQFYLLLGNLMSPDNTVRKQAEVRGIKLRCLFVFFIVFTGVFFSGWKRLAVGLMLMLTALAIHV